MSRCCRVASQSLRQLSLQLQPVSEPVSRPVSQSPSQPVGQSASQPVSQPVSQSACQPVSQSAGQPVSQSTSPPVRQSASQPVSQSVSQSARANLRVQDETWAGFSTLEGKAGANPSDSYFSTSLDSKYYSKKFGEKHSSLLQSTRSWTIEDSTAVFLKEFSSNEKDIHFNQFFNQKNNLFWR